MEEKNLPIVTILHIVKALDPQELDELAAESNQASRFFEDISPIANPFAFFNEDNQFMNKREKLLADAAKHIAELSRIARNIEDLERNKFGEG